MFAVFPVLLVDGAVGSVSFSSSKKSKLIFLAAGKSNTKGVSDFGVVATILY